MQRNCLHKRWKKNDFSTNEELITYHIRIIAHTIMNKINLPKNNRSRPN